MGQVRTEKKLLICQTTVET